MGGQACVLYGSSEFSRDLDLVILVEPNNIANFKNFLVAIKAEVVAVPDFNEKYLEKGHAIHFRAGLPELLKLRIDIMSKLRNVDEFQKLWDRRTTLEVTPDLQIDVLSVADLVKAKKTARDKDWPMIKQLTDLEYLNSGDTIVEQKIMFFLSELRTVELLIECAIRNKKYAQMMVKQRPLLLHALNNDIEKLAQALKVEESLEREEDKKYWAVLKQELEKLRHVKR